MSQVSVGLSGVQEVLPRAAVVGEVVRKGGMKCHDGYTIIARFWYQYDRMDECESRINFFATETQQHSQTVDREWVASTDHYTKYLDKSFSFLSVRFIICCPQNVAIEMVQLACFTL